MFLLYEMISGRKPNDKIYGICSNVWVFTINFLGAYLPMAMMYTAGYFLK